jgi:hypothetical protein
MGPAPLSDWAPASWTSQQRTDALTTAWCLLSRGGRRLHRAVHERPLLGFTVRDMFDLQQCDYLRSLRHGAPRHQDGILFIDCSEIE